MSISPGIDRQLAVIREEVAAAARALHNDIVQLEKRIMSKMDDFKADLTAYVAQVQAWFDAANANQATSDQLVAAAVAKAQAGEDVDVQALSDQLAAAAAKVPATPSTPPTPPATT